MNASNASIGAEVMMRLETKYGIYPIDEPSNGVEVCEQIAIQ